MITNDFLEEKIIIGYQGVEGAYSHEALLEYFPGDFTTINVNEFEDVFLLLKEGKIKYGVLPIENSSTGGIADVIDLLYKYDTFIVGEKCIKINHNLLGIEGTTIEDIEEVYSHPQAFQQCSEFFKGHGDWKLISYYNTAKSVEFIKNTGSKHYAAVGSKKAADLYNVNIIKEGINNNSSNYTRFIIIGNEVTIDQNNDKVSVVTSTAHKSGALFEIVRCIAENGLNMLKIESRPIINRPWEYLFYIDFEGNLKNNAVQEALKHIKENSYHFKLLGNYKCDQNN